MQLKTVLKTLSQASSEMTAKDRGRLRRQLKDVYTCAVEQQQNRQVIFKIAGETVRVDIFAGMTKRPADHVRVKIAYPDRDCLGVA